MFFFQQNDKYKSRLNVSKHLNKKCHQRFTTVFFRSLFDRDISVFVLIT